MKWDQQVVCTYLFLFSKLKYAAVSKGTTLLTNNYRIITVLLPNLATLGILEHSCTVIHVSVVWWFMVLNATFNNISVISWRSVLLVEDTRVPGENHRPVACHWQTLSHNVVSSMPHHERGSNCGKSEFTYGENPSLIFNFIWNKASSRW